MTPRSYLFVPGDSARKIDKAASSSADAIILDLEDSVAPSRKDEALRTTRDFLGAWQPGADAPEVWVRANAIDSNMALAELSALPLARLAGVFYPKLASHSQLAQMGHWLDALEQRDGLAQPVRIVGIITESAAALAGEQAATLARGHPRLRGYAWGIEDLSADLGRPPLGSAAPADRRIAESVQLHCLYTASAAGVDAIDGISTAIHDVDGLTEACQTAVALGYTAKMAIHPGQIETIHQASAPAASTIEWAERVQALVRDHPEQSVFSLDGHMIDKPHVDIAQRILARAGQKE